MTNPTKMSLKNLMEFLSTPDGTSQNLDQNSQPGGAVHWNNLTGVPEIIKSVSDGSTSLLINWRGELASAPVPAEINDAYRNTTTKTSYLYTNTGWVVLAKDGTDGAPGLPGEDGGDGTPGTTPTIGVGSVTTGLPGTSAAVTSTPTATGANFNFTIPRGADGAPGPAGANGTSIVWKGEYASHPASPSENWAYRNTTDKKSYIYASGSWQTMCVDGAALPSGAPTAAPVISSPLAWNAVTSTYSTYLITAYNSPTSFGASGLPLGFSINTATGLISGSSSIPGEYPIVISATNVIGTDQKSLVIYIAGSSTFSTFSTSNTAPMATNVPGISHPPSGVFINFADSGSYVAGSLALRNANEAAIPTVVLSEKYGPITTPTAVHEVGISNREYGISWAENSYMHSPIAYIVCGTARIPSISTFDAGAFSLDAHPIAALPGFTGVIAGFNPFFQEEYGSTMMMFFEVTVYSNGVVQGNYGGSETIDPRSNTCFMSGIQLTYSGNIMILRADASMYQHDQPYNTYRMVREYNLQNIQIPLNVGYDLENRRFLAGLAGDVTKFDFTECALYHLADIR